MEEEDYYTADDYAENEPHESCPRCGKTYDDIDFDFQCCSKCGWDVDNDKYDPELCREPGEDDFMSGDADIISGEWI